jgi:hypothetical protein
MKTALVVLSGFCHKMDFRFEILLVGKNQFQSARKLHDFVFSMCVGRYFFQEVSAPQHWISLNRNFAGSML